jgi:hypothetical protein
MATGAWYGMVSYTALTTVYLQYTCMNSFQVRECTPEVHCNNSDSQGRTSIATTVTAKVGQALQQQRQQR